MAGQLTLTTIDQLVEAALRMPAALRYCETVAASNNSNDAAVEASWSLTPQTVLNSASNERFFVMGTDREPVHIQVFSGSVFQPIPVGTGFVVPPTSALSVFDVGPAPAATPGFIFSNPALATQSFGFFSYTA